MIPQEVLEPHSERQARLMSTLGRSQNACLVVIGMDFGQHIRTTYDVGKLPQYVRGAVTLKNPVPGLVCLTSSLRALHSNAIHHNDGYLKVVVVGAYPSVVQCPGDPAINTGHSPRTNGSFRLEETASNERTP